MTTISTGSGDDSGVTLHYDDTAGAGRPVVLIHGWPLSGAACDYNSLSDDLAALLDHLELTDVTLVGFSMGGGEVARYIARHGQERLHSVVFASAVPP